MSQENVKLAERVVAAVNERDVDGYLACCADEIKLRTPWAAVEGVYEGPEAIRRFFADLQDWAPNFRLTIERAEPIGATRVLVFLRVSLRGRASGLPAGAISGRVSDAPAARDLSTATVCDFAGGKVTSIRVFLDRDQAEIGVSARRAMYLLGHTDPKFTMRVYQQVLDLGGTAPDQLELVLGCTADEAFWLLSGREPRTPVR